VTFVPISSKNSASGLFDERTERQAVNVGWTELITSNHLKTSVRRGFKTI
jgi:hypothetical protein